VKSPRFSAGSRNRNREPRSSSIFQDPPWQGKRLRCLLAIRQLRRPRHPDRAPEPFHARIRASAAKADTGTDLPREKSGLRGAD